MSNRRYRNYPQTVILRCPCCQMIYSVLLNFDSKGEAEFKCDCGHISKVKLTKLNDK